MKIFFIKNNNFMEQPEGFVVPRKEKKSFMQKRVYIYK